MRDCCSCSIAFCISENENPQCSLTFPQRCYDVITRIVAVVAATVDIFIYFHFIFSNSRYTHTKKAPTKLTAKENRTKFSIRSSKRIF